MEEHIDVEAECKNCSHAISVHKPRCSAQYRQFNKERVCGCERPEYYGALISDTNMGWTEFHCNNCGKLRFSKFYRRKHLRYYRRRTSIMYELYCNKEMNMKEQNTIVK